MNKVEMFVNGKIYTGWLSAKVTRSIKAVAGSFELSVANNWTHEKKGWIISPLDETIIKIDGETIITGFVDKISSSFDGKSRSITISGRDRTGDLVDCSYVGPASLDGITLGAFIQKVISPFGLKFKSEVDLGTKVDNFKAQQGETCFAFLERALKLRGLLMTSNVQGELIISKVGSKRSTSALHESVNVNNCSFEFDGMERFSVYMVKGQSSGSEEFSAEQTSQVSSSYKDVDVSRYRPLIIMAEGNVDSALAQQRAKWESITRSAKSSTLKVGVKGWKRKDGTLWVPNEIVHFESTYFGFNLDLLISEIVYEQDSSGGTRCEMTLERSDAYQMLGKAKETRDIWKELNPQ